MPSFLVSCFICGINMPLYEFSGVSGWLDLQRVFIGLALYTSFI